MFDREDDEDGFMVEPAINLLGTVLYQIKFYLRDDTTEVVNVIVPELFVNRFNSAFKMFIEDAYEGLTHSAPSIYDVFGFFPDFDFDFTKIEAGDIVWALNVPAIGFPGWLEGYSL